MMKKWKMKKKLLVCFIAIAILASLSGFISIFILQNVDKNYSDALVNYGFAQGDIGKAMTVISESNRCVRDVVTGIDAGDIAAAKDELQKNITKTDGYLEDVKKTLVSQEAIEQYAKCETSLAAYRAKREELLKFGDTLDPEITAQAHKRLSVELDPMYADLYQDFADLMAIKVNVGSEKSDILTRSAHVTTVFMIILVVAVLIVSIVIAIAVARVIVNPIKKCVDRLLLLEKGDLHSEVPSVDTEDEIGDLAKASSEIVGFTSELILDVENMLDEIGKGNFTVTSKDEKIYVGDYKKLKESFDKIVTVLSGTMENIRQSSDQVASGSDQVSSASQGLSQGATEQASSVQELAATITEISDHVNKNAQNAQQANLKSQEMARELETGEKQMAHMVSAMDTIKETSANIGKIIKTIEDIAFQTNILALNAAVEAARAGSAGKGFAVVADEVRNLASKSAEASKNTAALIESSIASVQEGTEVANETAESLKRIVAASEEAASLVNMISGASQEQAISIAQVTQGIDQISSVVQTNSATAEECAAASEELSGQAQILKGEIAKFRLKNSASSMMGMSAPASDYSPAPSYNEQSDDCFIPTGGGSKY